MQVAVAKSKSPRVRKAPEAIKRRVAAAECRWKKSKTKGHWGKPPGPFTLEPGVL